MVKSNAFTGGAVAGLTSTENIVLALGKGIDFSANANATGMTSELLNYYEEGTFTPTVTQGTIVNLGASYTKTGNRCALSFGITTFSDITTAANISIGGLPFAHAAGSDAVGAVLAKNVDMGGTETTLTALLAAGSAQIFLYGSDVSGMTYTAAQHIDLTIGSATTYITITYKTA